MSGTITKKKKTYIYLNNMAWKAKKNMTRPICHRNYTGVVVPIY